MILKKVYKNKKDKLLKKNYEVFIKTGKVQINFLRSYQTRKLGNCFKLKFKGKIH